MWLRNIFLMFCPDFGVKPQKIRKKKRNSTLNWKYHVSMMPKELSSLRCEVRGTPATLKSFSDCSLSAREEQSRNKYLMTSGQKGRCWGGMAHIWIVRQLRQSGMESPVDKGQQVISRQMTPWDLWWWWSGHKLFRTKIHGQSITVLLCQDLR